MFPAPSTTLAALAAPPTTLAALAAPPTTLAAFGAFGAPAFACSKRARAAAACPCCAARARAVLPRALRAPDAAPASSSAYRPRSWLWVYLLAMDL